MNTKVKTALKTGIKSGWSGYLWMLKILIPISFLTACLVAFGLINRADFLLEPVMRFLGLPPMAALPLITGLFTGIYGGIATMNVLPLSTDHMTLIAIFLLISHNMFQEGFIQGKTGFSMPKACCVRLFTSVVTVLIVSKIMNVTPDQVGSAAMEAMASQTPSQVFTAWGKDTLYMCLQIFCIIMPLMMVMETMKSFNLIEKIIAAFSPLLKLMGLGRETGFLWLTAAIFGLSYGAAVLMEETRKTEYDEKELKKLQISIGINHAMIEDPALFLPLGLHPLWLWIPRLVAAITAVMIYNAWDRVKSMGRAGAEKSGSARKTVSAGAPKN